MTMPFEITNPREVWMWPKPVNGELVPDIPPVDLTPYLLDAQAESTNSRAYDLLTADGVSDTKASEIIATCQSTSRDPVAFAEHFIKLRHAIARGRGEP
jgi:hypothetical protein